MPKGRHVKISRPLIPHRRWPRRLLVAANVMVATFLVAAGGAYAYVRYRIDAIPTQGAPNLTTKGGNDGGSSDKPENILLIGNQTRAGLSQSQAAQFGNPAELSGSLSDVLMILHLDPAKHTASLLSIPRDLFAPMPAGSPVGPWQKIDAALNDGSNGVNNLIAAVQQDFGIPINHYVELEFNGFANTVDALGGIKMYFPEPVWDSYSLLYVPTPGCIQLNGTRALAVVRARHLQYDPPGGTTPRYDWPYDPESDLSRIVRDHTFLRVLFSTALHRGLGDPVTLNSFLGAITNQITIDPGLKNQLVSLAETYRHVSPDTIAETTLPVVPYGGYHYRGYAMGDVDFPVQPADDQTIAAWDHDALPAPVSPTSVDVYNITGTGNLATDTARGLAAYGLPIGTVGSAAVPAQPTETLVRYAPGNLAQAEAVFSHLSGPVMLDLDPGVAPGTVTVDAGTDLVVVPPAGSGGSGVTGSGGPGASAGSGGGDGSGSGVTGGPGPSGSDTARSDTGGSRTAGSGTAGSGTAVTSQSGTAVTSQSGTAGSGTAGSGTAGGTELGQTPSSTTDHLQPWDPRPCPAG